MLYHNAIGNNLNLPLETRENIDLALRGQHQNKTLLAMANDEVVTDDEFGKAFYNLSSNEATSQKPPQIGADATTQHLNYDFNSYSNYHTSRGEAVPQVGSQNHGFSRIPNGPNAGLILKHPNHRTLGLTIKADWEHGAKFYRYSNPNSQYSGRWYSFLPNELENHPEQHFFQAIPRSELQTIRWQAYPIPAIMDKTSKHEGFEPSVYRVGQSSAFNIGYGHNLERGRDSKQAIQEVLPHKDWNALRGGTDTITEEEARSLLLWDVKHHISRAEERYPTLMEWATSSDEVYRHLATVLIDAVYETSMGPKTRALINEGKWFEAAEEVLDRKLYRELKAKDDAAGVGAVPGGHRERWDIRKAALLAVAKHEQMKQDIRDRTEPESSEKEWEIIEMPSFFPESKPRTEEEEIKDEGETLLIPGYPIRPPM